MDTQDIKTLLDKIKSLRIAVYGDFTLDAYWVLDPRKSEISVETGLQAEAVGKQNFSLGGAANVVDASPDDIFPAEKVRTFAENLYKMYSRPVFISRGNRGLIAFDKNGYTVIPGLQFLKKTDTVGAGDTVISALACSLAAGASVSDSAQFANFAAGVTVQKLFQTGTASGEEILEISSNPDYIYQPELASDIRQATLKTAYNLHQHICSGYNTPSHQQDFEQVEDNE